MANETMTVKEAAARLHLGLATVYELIEKEAIPARRIGPSQRKILLDVADVEAYWDSCKGVAKLPEVKSALRHVRPQSRARRPS